MVMLDESGARLVHRTYTPFGEEHAVAGSADWLPSHYAGHLADEDSGLVYMQARWYDAEAGVFLSVDSVVGDAFDPQAFNAYAYARNNPVRYTDPTGAFFDDSMLWSTTYYFSSGVAIGLSASAAAYEGAGAVMPEPCGGLPWWMCGAGSTLASLKGNIAGSTAYDPLTHTGLDIPIAGVGGGGPGGGASQSAQCVQIACAPPLTVPCVLVALEKAVWITGGTLLTGYTAEEVYNYFEEAEDEDQEESEAEDGELPRNPRYDPLEGTKKEVRQPRSLAEEAGHHPGSLTSPQEPGGRPPAKG
jgi:RHS repeat-associated protein